MKIILFVIVLFTFVTNGYSNLLVVSNSNDSGNGSLREVITNSAINGDTIRFSSTIIDGGSQTIELSSAIFFNKSITIIGSYNETDTLYISGNNSNSIFIISNTSNVILDSLVLLNGYDNGGLGGAVRFHESDSLYVFNTIISNCTTTGYGGAIGAMSANSFPMTVNIVNCKFTENNANRGGGVYIQGSFESDLTILNSNLVDNNASGGGGGVYSESLYRSSMVLIDSSTISNNSANNGQGGGIRSTCSNVQFTTSGSSFSTSLIVTNSSINNNSSGDGGGIHVSSNTPSGSSNSSTTIITLNNSTMCGNNSTESGGAIFSFYENTSSITVTNSTIFDNNAVFEGGGIYTTSPYTNYNSELISKGSIIALNGNSNIVNHELPIISNGYNIFSDQPIGYDALKDYVNVTNSQLNLQPLNFNGGTYKTRMPGEGSLAIDSGDTTDLSNAQNRTIVNSMRDIGSTETTCIMHSIQDTVCYGESVIFNGITHDANNLSSSTIFYDIGLVDCDSTVTFNLSILPNIISDSTVVACNSFTWFDTIFTSSIITTHTIPTSSGCDSVLTLNLTINTSLHIDTIIACESHTWIDGITYTSNNNTATYTFIGGGSSGCDSIVQLNLTINGMTYEEEHITVCEGESYTFPDGVIVDNINSFFNQTVVLSTVADCDSVIIFYINVNEVNFTDSVYICSGDTYIFPDGVTGSNILSEMNHVSNLISASGDCDSIITTTVIVTSFDNTVTLNGVTISSAETNANNYTWLDCDDDNSILFPSSTSVFDFQFPGNFAVEITKNGCVDTSNCITITNQYFYDLPNYTPLSAEVFTFPVSSLDTCDGLALGFGNGGFPPYSFDWFTQTNNGFYSDLDSLCEGFHTLKVYDNIGDSTFVNYFVTDSLNWYDWYEDNASFVDTIYMQAENCDIDMNLPLDSSNISNFHYLYSGPDLNEDYYYMEIAYFQAGVQYTYGDTTLMELNGVYLIDFSITCPTRSTARIKTIITTLDYPTILSVNTSSQGQFKIYPNPTLNNITIDFGEMNTNSNLLITDFSGKIIYNESSVNTKAIKVNLTNYSAGIYFVTVKNNIGKNVMKLVKQ